MIKANLILTTTFKNGTLRYKFNQLEIFRILLCEFGYSYIKLKSAGKFLKSVPGGYKIVPFSLIIDHFSEYLRYEIKSEILPKGLTHETLLNMHFDPKKSPIKQNYAMAYFHSKNRLCEEDFIIEDKFFRFK